MSKDLALTLISIIRTNGAEAYLVGGCVRDYLLGLEPKDYDITTPASPEEVRVAISSSVYSEFFHVIDTGIKYGTITVFDTRSRETVEITTFRKDTSGGRHPSVEFTSDIKEDADRRDFTINSIYWNGTYHFKCFNSGLVDLTNKVLRAVGNTKDRITEDPLRILRAVRFALKYDLKIIDLDVYIDNVFLLETVSAERIWSEIKAIFNTLEGGSNDFHEQGILLLNHILRFVLDKQFIYVEEMLSLDQVYDWGMDSKYYFYLLIAEALDISSIPEVSRKLKMSNVEATTLRNFSIMSNKQPSIAEAYHLYNIPIEEIEAYYGTLDAQERAVLSREFPLSAKDLLPFTDKPKLPYKDLKDTWIIKYQCDPSLDKEFFIKLYKERVQ